MEKRINDVLLECIKTNRLLPYNTVQRCSYDVVQDCKVALIGEEPEKATNADETSSYLNYKLTAEFNLRDITVFTSENQFTIEDGERFDILIGCRPCEAEELILKSATKYKKRFVLLPCLCGGAKTKSVDFIREYPVITHIDTSSEHYDDDSRDMHSWIVLFNKRSD